ncbi:MAG: alpha/beta fold hydrolase [Chloroflexi bacterium]|nr:alpha/beta fold hydrolase [Chloroflexota bacterium]
MHCSPCRWLAPRRVHLSLLLAAALAVVAGVLRPAPSASAQDAPAGPPRFTPGPCPSGLELPEGFVAGETARCGVVVVPQSRARLDLPPVTLPVIVYTTPATPPGAVPLMYLAGGPGGPGILEVNEIFLASPLGQALVRERPVIAFDQRGTGFARPALTCPNVPGPGASVKGAAAQAVAPVAQADLVAQATACRGTLAARGIELGHFNTSETAHDVNDIRRALGYERVILMGTSYGTTGVLFTLRQYPEIVVAAVLDGVAPPQWLDGYETHVMAAEQRAALERYLADCAADIVCQRYYPRLREQFAELEVRADELLPVVLLEPAEDALTELEVPLGLVGSLLAAAIADPDLNGRIPDLVGRALAGDVADLAPSLARFAAYLEALDDRVPDALYNAVLCSDFPPGAPAGGRAVCDALGVAYQGPAVSAPVLSTVPTLLLSGNYDFQTPPAWAAEAARTLPNSRSYLFPAVGHVVYPREPVAACVAVIVLSFLDDPSAQPADGCAGQLTGPRFMPPARVLQ